MAITPLDMGASHDPVRTRRLDAVPRLPGGIPDGAGRGAEEPRSAARVVAFSTRPRGEGTRGPEDGTHAPGNDRHQERGDRLEGPHHRAARPGDGAYAGGHQPAERAHRASAICEGWRSMRNRVRTWLPSSHRHSPDGHHEVCIAEMKQARAYGVEQKRESLRSIRQMQEQISTDYDDINLAMFGRSPRNERK